MSDTTPISAAPRGGLPRAPRLDLRTSVILLKPRVMSLVVFTAAAGLLVAPGGTASPVTAALAVMLIALGGGASGALNMWWDADIDAVMRRTAKRPIPAGAASPRSALWLGLILSVLAVWALGMVANWAAAGLLAFTIFFYAVIYTMWLKRRTPQNIVIGGAAGAFPPMIGWAVATGGVSLESVLMFALIFMWTPPHFWALALFMNDDYTRAGVPMLTVTHGRRATRRHILIYALLLAPVALLLALTSVGGPVYLLAALWLNAYFVTGAIQLWRRSEALAEVDAYQAEKRYFRQSLVYLFLHFAALIADAALRAGGLSLWVNWPTVF